MMVSVSGISNSNLLSGHALQKRTKVAFKGGVGSVTKKAEEVVLPKMLKGFTWLRNNDGEIFNAIMTAVGTAFVAPIFIAYNPLSKADKETKTYSAWRQPISAVLALATQVPINIGFNKWLDKLASTGQLERANLSIKPTESYLKSIVKKENPSLSGDALKEAIKAKQQQLFDDAIKTAQASMKDKKIGYAKLITKKGLDNARTEVVNSMKEDLRRTFAEDIKNLSEENAASYIDKIFGYRMKNKVFAKGLKIKTMRQALNNAKAAVEKEFAEVSLNTDVAKKLGNTAAEILQSVKIKHFISASSDNAVSVLKSYRKYAGIVVSLATLPFSCGLLNWVYPRLMAKIMPETVKKKQAKEQVQLVKVQGDKS